MRMTLELDDGQRLCIIVDEEPTEETIRDVAILLADWARECPKK